jgi:hypothetical protein
MVEQRPGARHDLERSREVPFPVVRLGTTHKPVGAPGGRLDGRGVEVD